VRFTGEFMSLAKAAFYYHMTNLETKNIIK
jgi:hypothetical protein